MTRSAQVPPLLSLLSLVAAATPSSAQTIQSVSSATIARSERLVVTGAGFGAEQGASQLLIGGVPGVVTSWSDTKIRAHVRPDAPLGGGFVQVVGAAPGNQVPITIEQPAPGVGHVKWRRRTDHYYTLSRPAVAPDGTIYITGVAGPLYSFSPSGDINWVIQNAGGVRPPTVGPDGTVYMAGGGGSVTAASPAGEILWSYNAPSTAGPMFVGPSVGPDGKIYAVTEEEPSLGTDFGALALNPDGTLAWHHSGGYNFRHAPSGWEIVFSAGRLFFATGQGFPSTGNPGVHALDMASGQEEWTKVGIAKVQTDVAGNLYWLGAINNNYIGSYTPAGSERWTINYNEFQGQPGGFVVAPDGTSFYGTSTFARIAAINADGSVRWKHTPGHQVYPYGATPDSKGFIAGAVLLDPISPRIRHYSGADGSVVWEEFVPFEEGVWLAPSWEGAFSPDGETFYLLLHGNNYSPEPYSYLYAFDVSTDEPCYPDCDESGSLDFFDFLCFQNQFATGQAYADCDASGSLDFFDFLCFQNSFAVGCR